MMTAIRSGILLTATRMTLNDLEYPIHLKVRLAPLADAHLTYVGCGFPS